MESFHWQDSPIEKRIQITIDCIENVVRENISVSFIVEHHGNILGESTSTKIQSNVNESSLTHEIDFVVTFSIILDEKHNINEIVSTPILIKAVNTVEKGNSISDVEAKKRTKFTTKTPLRITSNLIGVCSLDLIPLLLGEKSFTEKLILETPRFSFDGTSVSWQNLPLLTVTVLQDDVPFFPLDERKNFLNITVESIYNLPKSFTENLEYKAGTVAYVDSEIPENIIFENGTLTKYRDVERMKRWNTLSALENRARLSKYKLDCDFVGVKNTFKEEFDLSKKVCEDVPRIEWNSVSRMILWNTGSESMQKHIARYRYWPFQFLMEEKIPETKSKEKSSTKSHLYQCYVDVSELLFPGKTSTRVVTQLYTYNSLDISEKVGLQKNIFNVESQIKEPKEKDKKSKTSKQSVRSETEIQSSVPVTSETGESTVVVIEIELYQPLIPSRIAEDYSTLIDDLISEKEKPRYPYTGDVAEEQYDNCIQKLVEVITESYRDFRNGIQNGDSLNFETEKNEFTDKGEERYCYDEKSDELTCFTQYLYKTGTYLALRSTLRSKVIMLLDQKLNVPSSILDSKESQDFIVWTYTYLVEKMHMAVNKIVEGRPVENLPCLVNSKKLHFYAEEAYEMGYTENAKRYYTTVIASNKDNPDAWTKYAVFLLKMNNIECARECCLEAIALNRQHKVALLIYAAILFRNQEYQEAEIFLRTVTDLYPRFAEGWTILHLFYTRTEYYAGVDLTIHIAEKCMKDKNREMEIDQTPLAWSTIHCPTDSAYAVTIIFLLNLHLCEFAEIALAREMTDSSRSTHVLYYMAVEHYLSGRYEDALSHLKEARCSYGMDYSISSLMGHCYYQIGDFHNAMECYEFSYMLFNRPDDVHLIEIRMGFYYHSTGDYQRAKKLFLSASKSSPTSQTWFGAGISFYQLNEFKQAEAALSEANKIDNCNPDIWGYLCLLNITLQRYDEFAQCYRETIKNNLKNRKLWLMITKSMEAFDYAPPILTVASENSNLLEDCSRKESDRRDSKTVMAPTR